MAELKPASSRQQTNTEIVMDCETELKALIKQAVLNVAIMADFQNRKRKIIKEAIDQIEDDEELKAVAEKSLNEFVDREYRRFVSNLGLGELPLIVAFVGLKNSGNRTLYQVKLELEEKVKNIDVSTANMAFGYLGNSQAKVRTTYSLFAESERNARYNEQLNNIQEMKKITNLVIASTHADCSDRCKEWQGLVYSLDGTYGKTDDGREYRPLEVATQAIYKGHVNGLLLGYNCRHSITPYRTGLKPVEISEKERLKENLLTTKQRYYERKIRKYKAEAHTMKKDLEKPLEKFRLEFNGGTKKALSKKRALIVEKAKKTTAEYEQFCRDNNRVIYRSRIKI